MDPVTARVIPPLTELAADYGIAERHHLLDLAIGGAKDALLTRQHPDGYWCFELEADCTIPAEYILMMHYMDEVESDLQAKIAVYLRHHRVAEGGWPLFYGGGFDLSCSVKAYYALKLAGDRPDLPHMTKARAAIRRHGGAARANVFTRILLALFEQVPWRAVPVVPVEIMLLPRWFPCHLSKVSYWSRTVVVPLSILCSLKARARNPQSVHIRELFTTPPEQEKHYFEPRSKLNRVFLALDRFAHAIEPLIPMRLRRSAAKRAETWFIERLNGQSGLGAIFPAMVNAYEALDTLGYPPDHPYRVDAKEALRRLLVIKDDQAYCQPCVSPVWDTALACLALQETGDRAADDATRRAFDWLQQQQLVDNPGDWRECRPQLQGGGWPFQFQNDYYPDIDDTSAVAWAMARVQHPRDSNSIRLATDWIAGMQSRNGGFASFDVDNTHDYLNEIPFADHGALLDPPTADVSARCALLMALAGAETDAYEQALEKCLAYLRHEQEADGSWFGRWGTNYIYGTWSVLVALEHVGVPPEDPAVQRAVKWLKYKQHPDGGWGEDNHSYAEPQTAGEGRASTSFQTAWAILGLMAAGEADSDAVRWGVDYLLRTQREDGTWEDAWYTAPGFPRVFYLKYHGYTKYFPLWALARYRVLSDRHAIRRRGAGTSAISGLGF